MAGSWWPDEPDPDLLGWAFAPGGNGNAARAGAGRARRKLDPRRLVILTTSAGGDLCREILLAPETGALRRYGKDWQADWAERLADTAEMAIVETDTGDLDSPEAVRRYGEVAVSLLREASADADAEIHLSIAGGRKPSAAILALAMSLFGRQHDRMSHVLVSRDLEGHPGFFYPPPASVKMAGPDGRVIDGSAARVTLIDIPFPRLRGMIDHESAPFEALVAEISRKLARPRLVVDAVRGRITWDGRPFPLPPALGAWLSWLAAVQWRTGKGLPRVGASRADYLRHYRRFATGMRSAQAMKRLPDPLDPEWMEEKASRIAKLAEDCGIRPRGARLVQREGPRAQARYRLSLDRAEIGVNPPDG